ncbi:hypothetical protein MSAN_01442500 [Mycena sanguinolenta]|uniref:BTB domain-containing protein n=1 Tax=Mycena sanguinolenta TaxID=230812 RepID=A0A8H6Y6P3_9AGAR|nr:hypothetical protein MSAN_01442500 [Mycena sanguinolenta]
MDLDWDNVMFNDVEYAAKYDHLPTPPRSSDGSPVADTEEDRSTVVSISTTFFSNAQHRPQPPDVILLSKDSVYFYVHSDLILDASDNSFRAMLPITHSAGDEDLPVLNVPEPSPVLNVMLHTIYDMSCAHYSPPFETLVNAVDSMPIYGIQPKSMILPSTSLFTLLLSHAPLFPLQLYALAAHYDIFDLAVPTSSHLLAFPLSRLSDEVVERMGAIYLKRQVSTAVILFVGSDRTYSRLFFLHFGRAEALKRVLGPPPHPHPPSATCDFQAQKGLSRAWALATAYLAWDVRPDMSINSLESALKPLAEHLSCDLCRNALNDRIRTLVIQWSVVKAGHLYLCMFSFDTFCSERYNPHISSKISDEPTIHTTRYTLVAVGRYRYSYSLPIVPPPLH